MVGEEKLAAAPGCLEENVNAVMALQKRLPSRGPNAAETGSYGDEPRAGAVILSDRCWDYLGMCVEERF